MSDRDLPPGMPDDAPDDPTTRVELKLVHELYELAHMACRRTWLYPEVPGLMTDAIQACALIGVEYLGTLESYIKGTQCSLPTARKNFADWIRAEADKWWDRIEAAAYDDAVQQEKLNAERAARLAAQESRQAE